MFSFSDIKKLSQCSLSIPPEKQKTSFFDYQGVWRTTFHPKWVNNFITFQDINLHPSKDWSTSKMFFTSDKVCRKSKNVLLFNKGNVYTWLTKPQLLLETSFPEDDLIKFEVLKTIWNVPGKNNNDENNNDATFQAKFFRSSFYRKNELNEIITTGKGCKQHNV